MKRLRRWPLNLATGLSLVLCVAAAVLLVRSLFTADWIMWQKLDRDKLTWTADVVASSSGRIYFGRSIYIFDTLDEAESFPRLQFYRRGLQYEVNSSWIPVTGGFWRTLGFLITSYQTARVGTAWVDMRHGTIPYWFIVLMTAILPAVRARRWLRQRHRRRDGLCVACGYDMRASFDRCPECGMVPVQILIAN